MSKHPIPDAALDDRLFFVGTAGSGKTYNAMGRVERLLRRNNRVVIPDPLGVWWGLRLSADGKQPSGYDVAIFGGPHGDLPLTEHAGGLIGETVAGMKESCILDLSQLGTKASERRFMLAFLTTLYKHTTGEPLHVVFDEADMWSPQRLLDKEGEAAKLLGMMETVVRRGRVRGFIPWLISQRPAVISKDVLSQADGIVAFKLTSSQDRDAIGDWVEGQADKAKWRELWAGLPTMERGQGLVWIPGRGILETVQFPVKETFDSSRTPKRGERATHAAELKPLDLTKLKERLSKVEAETKANDPKALRAQIATLAREKDQLARTIDAGIQAKSQVVDKLVIEKAEQRGYERGKAEGYGLALQEVAHRLTIIQVGTADVIDQASAQHKIVGEVLQWAKKAKPARLPSAPPRAHPSGNGHARALPPAAASRFPKPASQVKPVAGDGTYSGPQRKVLLALAMWRSLGHEAPSREMVAAVAGYSPSSGGFNNLLGGLKTGGAIDYPQPGFVTLLLDDVDVMSKEEGRNMLLNKLANPQKKIIAAVVDAGTRTREEIAADTGYSSGSGGYNNLLGSLRTLGIVDYPQQGSVAMSPWAQELLSGCGTGLSCL